MQLAQFDTVMDDIAASREEIEQARLLTLMAAQLIDTVGVRGARSQIAMIKVAVPNMACRVVDRAIQVYGAAGVSQASFLAYSYARYAWGSSGFVVRSIRSCPHGLRRRASYTQFTYIAYCRWPRPSTSTNRGTVAAATSDGQALDGRKE